MPLPKAVSPTILRSAQSLKKGIEVLKTLKEPDMRAKLKSSVAEQVPAVSKISTELFTLYGSDIKAMPMRQFVGTAVKAIMADEGYEVAEKGVRTPGDPVFTTGAVYRKVDAADDLANQLPELLERFVHTLHPAELKKVIMLAQAALNGG